MCKRTLPILLILAALALAEAQKTDDRLASLRFLVGHWNCSGKFLHSGKAISSDVVFESVLEGKWLLERHDDKPPFSYHALTEWGWDKDSKQFVATVQDSTGGLRTFYSPGWNENNFVWETRSTTPAQRFVYAKNSDKQIQIDYAVNKGSEWDTIDTLTCTLQGQ